MTEMLFEGNLDILSVDGVAATADIDMRPDAGETWEIDDLYIYHDDNGAARTTLMKFTDGSSEYVIKNFGALADSTNKYLRVDAGFDQPCILTRKHYFRLTVQLIAAGKKGYIRGFGRKYRGLPDDQGV